VHKRALSIHIGNPVVSMVGVRDLVSDLVSARFRNPCSAPDV